MDVARGPAPKTADSHDRIGGGIVDDNRSHTSEAGVVGQSNVDGDARRNTRVDSVSAILKDAVTCCRRQIVSGGYHMGKPHDGGPVGVYSKVQSMAYLSNRNEYEG
jgi:hypothetical protein